MRAHREPSPSSRRLLPRAWAFLVVGYTFGVVMAGTTLPTPLYPLYERAYGFGTLMTTVVYATYAIGVLLALVLVGSASDVVGRRPMLVVGVAASALGSLAFASDAGLPLLFAGRLLEGISAGVFTGTGTVAMVELAGRGGRERAGTLASAVNMLGLGCGPLLAGLLAAAAPAPLRLPYLADLALMVPAAVGLWFLPETVAHPARRLPAPTAPAVPAPARAVFLPASIVAFAAFAVFGLVTSIEPSLLRTLLHLTSPALAGLVVFVMFAGSAFGQVVLTRPAGRAALWIGCVVLLAGLVGIGVALGAVSLPLVVASIVVIGVGQGITFSAGIVAVAQASPADRRAQTVSAFFIVAYVGISIPVVAVGAAAGAWGLQAAGIAFTGVLAALTAAALVAVLRIAARRRIAA